MMRKCADENYYIANVLQTEQLNTEKSGMTITM